ncbi:MAG: queuosine precursor transporter [Acidimicrobiia bacterium]|nr:queuosine precursor transporter [Acidimicrobiia bacterium]
MRRAFTIITVLAAAYVAAQMMSDVASLRIVSISGFSMDAGTLVYPLTFTLRDLVHKVAGKHVARLLILVAAGINVVMALLFKLVAVLPADLEVGEQLAFGLVLAPVWRIVFASIVAEVIAELIDTEIYAAWVARLGRRLQWGRVLASNAVSVPLDSALFVAIAFVGVLPGSVVWAIFWSNVLVKGVVTVGSIPLIYAVRPTPIEGLSDEGEFREPAPVSV